MESLSLTIELLPKFYLGHPTPKPEIIDNLTIIYILPAKKIIYIWQFTFFERVVLLTGTTWGGGVLMSTIYKKHRHILFNEKQLHFWVQSSMVQKCSMYLYLKNAACLKKMQYVLNSNNFRITDLTYLPPYVFVYIQSPFTSLKTLIEVQKIKSSNLWRLGKTRR